MKTKNLVITLVVIAVIALAGCVLPISDGGQTIVEKMVGANPGPESTNSYQCYAGVCTHYANSALYKATSTPCSFISPSATSSLAFASINIDVATSTATEWVLATSTQMNATSSATALVTNLLASGSRGNFNYVGVVDNNILPPNTYVTWGVTGILKYTSTHLTGSCSAVFIEN